MDVQTIGIIVAIVVVVTIVLYVYDRRTKQQPVDLVDVTKLAVGAGSIAGGVTYAVGGESVSEVVDTLSKAAEVTQEMFVGKPEF
jgi:ethanolamine utilization microcompartment shell protein EutL